MTEEEPQPVGDTRIALPRADPGRPAGRPPALDPGEWDAATGGAAWIFRRTLDLAADAVRAAVPPGAVVLDAGCGPGRLVAALAASGLRAIGVDRETGMLALAARRPATRGGRPALARADLNALPFRSGFADAVVAASVLGLLELPRDLLSEAARVLAPGGVLIVTITNRKSLLLRWNHALIRRGIVAPPPGTVATVRLYTVREVTGMLRSAGFRVERMAHYNFVLETHGGLCPGRRLAQRLDRIAGRRGGWWARNVLFVARKV